MIITDAPSFSLSPGFQPKPINYISMKIYNDCYPLHDLALNPHEELRAGLRLFGDLHASHK
jgi:hypothetical protein